MTRPCQYCNLFIAYKDDVMVYVPYGGPVDLEPPDPRWIHAKCWDAADEDRRELTKRISYQGPYFQKGYDICST